MAKLENQIASLTQTLTDTFRTLNPLQAEGSSSAQ